MIKKLLESALGQRFGTIVFTLGLAAFGLWAFLQLKLEAYPDISDTQVIIVTQFAGRAAEEVEQQITIPLERTLNNVPNLMGRRSRTIFGLSVVELTFDYGTDDFFARQVVAEKLRDAELPDGVVPTLGPLTTPTGELYRYVVQGEGLTEMELRELQDWVITPRFLQEPGIADVSTFGGLVKQYQVEVNPASLEKYNISISQVAKAVSANNQNAGGAMVDNRQQSLVVRGVGLVRTTEDIEGIVLSAAKGAPVFVRDVGRVKIAPALPTGILGLDSKSGGVEGLVLMRRGENPSKVLEGIRSAVADLNATRLPAGVRLAPIYDRTELVGSTLRTVSRTLAEGFGIVFLVLLFFLGSLQAAMLTALMIPLSLLFAFGCMWLSGTSMSLLSLGALDFGIIVDGTLVMVEFILRQLTDQQRDPDGRSTFQVIAGAAMQVERPILFSLVILVSAYIPLFTLERVERRLFTPMAFTVCAALAGSLLLTMTLVPVLATFLFREGDKTWHNPLLEWLVRRYQQLLQRLLRRPGLVVLGGILIVAGALALGSKLGAEFLPQLDEGLIWIRASLPPGVSLAKSAETASDIRGILKRFPEVLHVTSQSGRVDSGTDPFGPNRNEFLVSLTPYSTWPAGRRKSQLVEEMSAKLHEEVPGADLNFTQPIIDMVTEAVTGSSADLAVILSGPDLVTLRKHAEATLVVLRDIRGAADTTIEQEAEQPQLRITLDRRALARYALNVADVQDIIELAIGGKAVSVKFEGERRFDITARYVAEARADGGAMGRILIHTPEGGRVPLSELAAIQVLNGASIIARRENQRQITVRTNIRGRDQSSYVSEAQRRFSSTAQLPPGYRVLWGGQFENLERARARMVVIMPITVVIIFLLLFWAFGSVRNAALVLLNVPYSIVGGVIALYLRGINLSVSAAVGFVSLFGVAVMSGVLYIAEMKRQQDTHGLELKEAVLTGAAAQLRPCLILIVVAMFGMVPAAFANGIGSDIQRPLATVVLGGLVSTLVLTLLVLPCAHYVVERRFPRDASAED
ncbi:MAG TPA: CusA/CzcA family heavy metal efflux RND transporter [Paludibaculum sp.]